jgi:two-component system CheB/CheR fusion protein
MRLLPPSQRLRLANVRSSGRLDTPHLSAEHPSKVSETGRVRVVKDGASGRLPRPRISKVGQPAVDGKALSIDEDHPATNKGLRRSKKELQTVNEELTGLNGQLQERLERQRTMSDDLQNVLYSTDVATIFLDVDLNIRLFTPATRLLFDVIPSDIGRPLADLNSMVADEALISDARTVLRVLEPVEREIEARSGAWYIRRIVPYRTQADGIEGVVITFADISHQKVATDALSGARTEADAANAAKSRFLAVASHDLRQPLQTLVLLQELLAKVVEGEKAKKLVARVEQTLSGMSGMLNALLDINKIEAGTVRAEMTTFRIDAVLERLTAELGYQAEAQRIALHVVPCGLSVRSDPRLLEQMVRNLLANALKYTRKGRVLLGCRRQKGTLRIEVWDTGVGIPDDKFQDIFEEYHQLDNAASNRNLGLGLGLSIVKRLGVLLDHPVSVRSKLGKGSVFSIEVRQSLAQIFGVQPAGHANMADAATVLIVEDDSEVRDILEIGLDFEGYQVGAACDGASALRMIEDGTLRPDLIISDYNLPDGMDGLQVVARLREKLRRAVPVIILTGDISTQTLRDIAVQKCVHLNKPASLRQLTSVMRHLLLPKAGTVNASASRPTEVTAASPVIFIVDDDIHVREAIRSTLEEDGRRVEDYEDGEAFLAAYRPGHQGCLLLDANLPGMSGIDLLNRLKDDGHDLPAIMITGHSDVPMAVQAMKAGASDFIEKPVRGSELLAGVARALEQSRDSSKLVAWREDAARHIAGLTRRQHQIMDMVLAGHPSKNIAADLGISQRTVENHRASIMKKTGSRSLPALARLALTASLKGIDQPVVAGFPVAAARKQAERL